MKYTTTAVGITLDLCSVPVYSLAEEEKPRQGERISFFIRSKSIRFLAIHFQKILDLYPFRAYPCQYIIKGYTFEIKGCPFEIKGYSIGVKRVSFPAFLDDF